MSQHFNNDIGINVSEHIGAPVLLNTQFHNFYEFYYLKSGKTNYFIHDAIYNLEEGDVLILPPNTMHYTTLNNVSRKRLLVYAYADFWDELKNEDMPSWDTVSIVKVKPDERIPLLLDELLNEYNGKKDLFYMKALMYELLVLLKRKDEKKDFAMDKSSYAKRVYEIAHYLNAEYSSDITLESTAKHFFITPQQLSKQFSAAFGITFSTYLRKYRIRKALDALSSTDKNITEIAFDVGFNSTNHFCKVFKSEMNISPLQFRKKYLK